MFMVLRNTILDHVSLPLVAQSPTPFSANPEATVMVVGENF